MTTRNRREELRTAAEFFSVCSLSCPPQTASERIATRTRTVFPSGSSARARVRMATLASSGIIKGREKRTFRRTGRSSRPTHAIRRFNHRFDCHHARGIMAYPRTHAPAHRDRFHETQRLQPRSPCRESSGDALQESSAWRTKRREECCLKVRGQTRPVVTKVEPTGGLCSKSR